MTTSAPPAPRTAAHSPRGISGFLTRLQGGNRFTPSDTLTYLYLIGGTLVMSVPVLWLVMSSFKPLSDLYSDEQTFLPYRTQTIAVAGYERPLDLYEVTFEDGTAQTLAEVSRVGIVARMIDPAAPETIIEVNINQRAALREIYFAFDNYTGAITQFPFLTYLGNSVVVTVGATMLTLICNSMAAFGLSKYRFRGRNALFLVMLSTLLVPVSVILIPAFLVVSQLNLTNTLLGLIIPGAATPTGVFLLRQYMLTIPDELLDAARVDGASEWRIFWQIILPLARPALAVLTIFSFMWRWNDFLWPLIVTSRTELFTLPVGLNAFQGDLTTQWNFILAMTVLTMLPITVVFALLQRFITSGIATTGIK
ncbi:MAG: carbohydrate ABC transporter permease [Pleurocapsa minor GSE-CHR-MK-17-07R]|jgi:alpha-1,4-digalacturonate transport system permease protein|nr:carbohydrate ABC transporter permease [Pleurocapsa minor GSE-CHR-MK 17-07R]